MRAARASTLLNCFSIIVGNEYMGIVRKDFLMREIEKAGKMIAFLLGLREKGDNKAAAEYIDENLIGLLNIDAEQLKQMNDEELIAHIEAVEMSPVMIECLSELLINQAEMYLEHKQGHAAKKALSNAIVLLDFTSRREKVYSMKRQQRVKELNEIINDIDKERP